MAFLEPGELERKATDFWEDVKSGKYLPEKFFVNPDTIIMAPGFISVVALVLFGYFYFWIRRS